jgi:hypothetical protein
MKMTISNTVWDKRTIRGSDEVVWKCTYLGTFTPLANAISWAGPESRIVSMPYEKAIKISDDLIPEDCFHRVTRHEVTA